MFSHFISTLNLFSSTASTDSDNHSDSSASPISTSIVSTTAFVAEFLPMPVSRENLPPLRNTSAPIKINTSSGPQRLYIEELEEIISTKNKSIDNIGLQIFQDFLEDMLSKLSNSTLDADILRQKQIELINLAREVQTFIFANINSKQNKKILQQIMNLAKEIYQSNAEEILIIKAKINKIREFAAQLLALENTSTGIKKRKFSESKETQSDTSDNEDKVSANSRFFSNKQTTAETPLMLAIKKGDAEEIAKIVGGDSTICSKLIPDESGNTYFKYALCFNHENIPSIIAALLPMEAVSAKSFKQLLSGINTNSCGQNAVEIAKAYNTVEGLREGMTIAIVKANKGKELYKSVDQILAFCRSDRAQRNPT